MLEKLIKLDYNDNYKVIWEEVEKIPEFAILKTCEQNPKWHSEGNAFIHTQKVCEEMEKLISNETIYKFQEDNLILLASALFHDIGKGVTTTMGKDGNWHQYGHEIKSEMITRRLLWDEPIEIREKICALVRYHMEPLKIVESKSIIYDIARIGARIDLNFLITLKICDIKGSIQKDGGTKAEDNQKLKTLLKLTNSTEWDISKEIPYYGFPNNEKYSVRDFLNRKFPWNVGEKKSKVILLMGVAGAGKNTYIDEQFEEGKLDKENTVVVSRDDIRIELGYCKEGEKYLGTSEEENKVSEVFNEKLVNAVKEGKTVVINNTNLKKKYRDAYKTILKDYNVIYEYVYIETSYENLMKRRNGQISNEIIENMISSFECPEAYEYDTMTFIRN